MKKRPLIVVIIILITLILIGGLFLLFGKEDDSSQGEYYEYDLVIDEYDDILEVEDLDDIVIEEDDDDTDKKSEETLIDEKDSKKVQSNKEEKEDSKETSQSNGEEDSKTNEEESVKQIKVELDIDENPGFALMDIRCYFDADVFDFVSYSNGTVHPSVYSTREVKKDKYGSYILLDFDYIDKEYTECGSLAYLVFDIKDETKATGSEIRFALQEVYNSVPEELEGVELSSRFIK